MIHLSSFLRAARRVSSSRLFLVSVIAVISLLIGGMNPALAADGSGTLAVSESNPGIFAGTTYNQLEFTYTSTESMRDGQLAFTVPAGWGAPTSSPATNNYTIISASTGTVASVLDSLDSTSGWTDTSLLVSESADTSVKKEGSASMSVSVTLGLGSAKTYHAFGSAQDWSSKNKVGFWIRPSNSLSLGTMNFVISETSNMSSVSEQYALPALPANVWTFVIFGLSSNTSGRDAVLSYGFQFPVTIAATYRFDNISMGPSLPTVQNQTASAILLGAPTGTVATIDYGHGGDANGVLAPLMEGTSTFMAKTRIDSSGTLTSLSGTVDVRVDPSACHILKVTGPATSTAGMENELTIHAYDNYGNTCDSGPYAFGGAHIIQFIGPNDSPDGTHTTLEGTATNADYATIVFSHGVSVPGGATFIPVRRESVHIDVSSPEIAASSFGDPAYGLDIAVSGGDASKLNFATQPYSGIAGQPIDPAPVIEVDDAYGNLLASTGTTITMSLGDNPLGGTLSGTLTATTSGGLASFSNLLMDRNGGGTTLVASSAGLASVTSQPFWVGSASGTPPVFLESAAAGNVRQTGFTISKAFTATSTNRYLLFSFMSEPVSIESVTWNGTPMTSLDATDAYSGRVLHLYGLADPDISASHDAVITLESGNSIFDGALLLYGGVSSTQPVIIGSFGTPVSSPSGAIGAVTMPHENSLELLTVTYGDDFDLSPLNDEILRASEHGTMTGGLGILERGPYLVPGAYTIGAGVYSGFAFRAYALQPAY